MARRKNRKSKSKQQRSRSGLRASGFTRRQIAQVWSDVHNLRKAGLLCKYNEPLAKLKRAGVLAASQVVVNIRCCEEEEEVERTVRAELVRLHRTYLLDKYGLTLTQTLRFSTSTQTAIICDIKDCQESVSFTRFLRAIHRLDFIRLTGGHTPARREEQLLDSDDITYIGTQTAADRDNRAERVDLTGDTSESECSIRRAATVSPKHSY